ncbi:MAG: hypothetical protein IPI93_14280 [Sphingobacteriaceae bacterium]|nr:hypothetical protein [Sphingobacteriaceae bacterium]
MKKATLFFTALVLTFCNMLFSQKVITGTVTVSNGKTFTLNCDQIDQLPTTTDTCSISKDISGTKNPFGITVQSGWMSVADAFFMKRKGNVIVFSIIRETSNIVINGKRQEHFVKGKKMKIAWK